MMTRHLAPLGDHASSTPGKDGLNLLDSCRICVIGSSNQHDASVGEVYQGSITGETYSHCTFSRCKYCYRVKSSRPSQFGFTPISQENTVHCIVGAVCCKVVRRGPK